MAFKNVNGEGKYKKLTDLKVGESLTGYFLGSRVSLTIEGAISLIMAIGDERFSVSSAGNVKYMLTDGKLVAGQNTRITRTEDKNVKGKKSTQFAVEQDPDDTIPVTEQIGALPAKQPAAISQSVADKIAAMKAGSANGATKA